MDFKDRLIMFLVIAIGFPAMIFGLIKFAQWVMTINFSVIPTWVVWLSLGIVWLVFWFTVAATIDRD